LEGCCILKIKSFLKKNIIIRDVRVTGKRISLITIVFENLIELKIYFIEDIEGIIKPLLGNSPKIKREKNERNGKDFIM
tara:strand:- start:309 stop:545 length:237 start_codon:yes stop_codon:yes gene_type:complete